MRHPLHDQSPGMRKSIQLRPGSAEVRGTESAEHRVHNNATVLLGSGSDGTPHMDRFAARRERCGNLMRVIRNATQHWRIFRGDEMECHDRTAGGRHSCANVNTIAIGASGTSRRVNEVLTCASTSRQLLNKYVAG